MNVDLLEYQKAWLNSIYGLRNIITIPIIEKVIFNYPATIVLWVDGTKTVVKCSPEEYFDPEKGLAMAISKKAFGNRGSYHSVFKKWIRNYEGTETVVKCEQEKMPDLEKLLATDLSKKLSEVGEVIRMGFKNGVGITTE